MACRNRDGSSSRCPHCGQFMPQIRCGVTMYPQTARVFDAIKRAGRDGIGGEDLLEVAWSGMKKRSYNTMKQHVYLIRQFLKGTEYEIRLSGSRRYPTYRLVKVVKVQAFANAG